VQALGRAVLEALAALLPAPERSSLADRYLLDAARGTRTGAGVGVLVGGLTWILQLIASLRGGLEASAGELRDFSEVGPLSASASPFDYATSPAGLLFAYVALTSVVRLVHVGLNGEPLADPMLAVLAWAGRRLTSEERRLARRLGPPRPDVVATSGDLVLVRTATRKPDWDAQATIQVGDRFHRVRSVEERPDGPWSVLVYSLEPVGPGAVFRKLLRYDPHDVPATEGASADHVPAETLTATPPPSVAPPAPSAGGRTRRFFVDEGEEARLTPEGPSAAVIESLGSLPLRARRDSGIARRPAFPGTAVMLGDARFEVVSEEAREVGVRYLLEPWPADHVQRDLVRYTPALVRSAQRERSQAVDVERRRRWSWVTYPFVGLLPEARQVMACERLGLEAATATLGGALLEALVIFMVMTGGGGAPLDAMRNREGIGFGYTNEAGFLMSTVLIRAFGALAFGEVAGSAVLGFAFELAQVVRPLATRFDASVVPLTREAFWSRLSVADRHEPQEDGTLLVRGLLPHLSWGGGGTVRIAAGRDWWSVTTLPPVLERGRLTYRYQLVPLGEPGLEAPDPPHVLQYQREVMAQVEREWDDVVFAAGWVAALLPEEVQERAWRSRGGPAAARTATLATACVEIVACLWFLVRPSPLDVATAAFFAFDGGRRVRRALSGRYGPSLLGGLVSDYLRPERRPYHAHLAAERAARAALRRP
jgi:hypothetical protein